MTELQKIAAGMHAKQLLFPEENVKNDQDQPHTKEKEEEVCCTVVNF